MEVRPAMGPESNTTDLPGRVNPPAPDLVSPVLFTDLPAPLPCRIDDSAMRLTLHTDLAFRTLIHLGLRPGVRVQTEEIASAWRISSNHLDKVVQRLAAAGFIET